MIPPFMNDPQPEGHMASHIGRRKFLATLGGAAVAWPLAARAQPTERKRRIGIIQPASSDDAEYQVRVGALLEELQHLGWVIGRNIQVETRWTKRDPDDTRKHAAELVALAPDAIVATGISTVGPLLQLTRTVPIVFPAASDPVAAGLVQSLARPGGNATGVSLVRIQFEWEMAGVAQTGRAKRHAGGSTSRPCQSLRNCPVRRHPGGGVVGWIGSLSG